MLNKEIEFAVAPVSLSQTYGNMTAYIVEYLKRHFDEEYFKSVTVASKIAYRYFDVLNSNKGTEFYKRSKPYLIVRPRLDAESNDKFLDGTYLTQRMFNGYDGGDYGNLLDFYRDDNIQLECRYLLNRFRMIFDVNIIVETQMEQMNIVNYLKNMMVNDRPFVLNCSLESLIPQGIINAITNLKGIEPDNIGEILNYMNKYSCDPVTFKRANSTGNNEFYRYYPATVDCTAGNLSVDDGSRIGMVDGSFSISFNIIAEFYGAGLYQIFSQSKDDRKLKLLCVNKHTFDERSIVDMVFTLTDIYNENKHGEGWYVYAAPTFKIERVDKPDKFVFKDLLNGSLTKAIDYHIEKNIPFGNLITLELYKDSKELKEGVDYTINYKKKSITVFNLHKISTYRLIININAIYIDQLVIDLLDKEDK